MSRLATNKAGPAASQPAGPPLPHEATPEAGPSMLPLAYAPSRVYLAAKRCLDLAIGYVALLLTAPIFLAAAVLIRLTSRGAIIYRQQRAGCNGVPFTCYKFRTMRTGAHSLRQQLSEQHAIAAPAYKAADDPRVTAVGRWLRKTSIDELPQLLNIVQGTMSLVGPRPHPVDEAACYNERERQRLLVKPGLTGLWQVSGRAAIPLDQRIEIDLEYVEHCGFWYDIAILCRTIPAVLGGHGAY